MVKKAREHPLLSRAAEMFDLPQDLVAGLPYMELLGDRELFLDSHQGILSYSGSDIHINAGAYVIRVHGRDLELLSMSENALRIGGQIQSLEVVK